MLVAVFSILVALFLGFGAAQELIVRGLSRGEVQPFFVGLAGIIVSILLASSGIARLLKLPKARQLVILAAVLSVVFHVYAALPPHRNEGIPALIIGAGYGLLLLVVGLSSRGMETRVA